MMMSGCQQAGGRLQPARAFQTTPYLASQHWQGRAALLRVPGHAGPAPAAQPCLLRKPAVCGGSRRAPLRVAANAAAAAAVPAPEPGKAVIPGQAAKIAALGLCFFCSTFNYTILQNLKDSIVVTAVGAEALPFLEAYGVLPMSVAFFVLFGWMNKTLPEKWVYQAALAPFLAYYALFAAVLYPLAHVLHPIHLLEGMRAVLPSGLVGLAGMIVHWTYSLFFIIGELWGGVAISLLFWGLADDVCSMNEAKEVYPLLGIIANVGLVIAGAWIKMVNKTLAVGNATLAVQMLLGTVIAVAGVLFVVKDYVSTHWAPTDPKEAEEKRKKKEARAAKEAAGEAAPKGGLGESLSVLNRSPKVKNLAVLVVAYFISQKLFDFAWKAQLRVFHPDPAAYQSVLADVSQLTGITTMVLMATSKYVFKWGGWVAAALATPLAMLVSGGIFFASAIAMQGAAGSWMGPQVVAALVAAGGVAGIIGRVVSRAPKYSLFDPAKEMVYITMSKEEKTEGKAAVDLVGAYLGKSGASWIMQAIVLVLGSMTHAMPVMGLVHVCVALAWCKSTLSLATLMKAAEAAGSTPSAAPSPSASSASLSSSTSSNGNGTAAAAPAQPAASNVVSFTPGSGAPSSSTQGLASQVKPGLSASAPPATGALAAKIGVPAAASTAALSSVDGSPSKPLIIPTKVGQVVVAPTALMSHDEQVAKEAETHVEVKTDKPALQSHLDE